MEITSDRVREIFKGLRADMKLRLAMGKGISRTRWMKASPQGPSRGFETLCKPEQKRTSEIGMVNKCVVFATMLCAAALSSTPHLQAQQSAVTNIVLVHGAWADGSGWKGVYNILVKDGFNVSIVQEPETSFQDDVTAVKRILALQDGPSILVAHSYGGSVITEAGTDPSVAGLVYIAAHMPDAGENEGDDGKRFPSDLGKSGALKKTADGFTYLDPAQFHEYFAADLSVEQAAFMARSQVLNFASNFSATSLRPPGELNRAGCSWREAIGPSTLTLNAGTLSELIATWSKSQAPVIAFMYRTPRKLQM